MVSPKRQTQLGRRFLVGIICAGLGLPAWPSVVLAQDEALANPVDQAPPTAVGRLALVDGPASFREAGQDPWTEAIANTPVIAGASLWTQPETRAKLELGHASLWLDGGTEVDLRGLDQGQVQLGLPQGRLDLRLGGMAPGENYTIAIGAGTVTLDAPGAYRINAGDARNPPSVSVFSGQAELSTTNGNQTVGPGQQAFASGAAAATQLAATEEDDFDQWVDGREAQTTAAVSPQFVPTDIPGAADLDAYGQWRNVPDYGDVWIPTSVSRDWQPYRDGHWQWIAPWGWTWIDNAPWGFAPFHYGRWVNINGWWSWVPGSRGTDPVYAPALVSFVGDPGALVGGAGPCVGWFPLGPGEIYTPAYAGFGGGIGLAVSFDYFRRLNPGIGNGRLRGFDDDGQYRGPDRGGFGGARNSFVNQRYTTVVHRETFVDARPIGGSALSLRPGATVRAAFTPAQASLPMTPTRASEGAWRTAEAPPRAFRNLPITGHLGALAEPRAPYRPATSFGNGGVSAPAPTHPIVPALSRPVVPSVPYRQAYRPSETQYRPQYQQHVEQPVYRTPQSQIQQRPRFAAPAYRPEAPSYRSPETQYRPQYQEHIQQPVYRAQPPQYQQQYRAPAPQFQQTPRFEAPAYRPMPEPQRAPRQSQNREKR